MDRPLAANLLPETALVLDRGSRDFLQRSLIVGDGVSHGKVVFAKEDGIVVLGLGELKSFHVEIIERATREILGYSVLSDSHVDRPKIRCGVIVEGARFLIEGDQVKVYGESLAFGPFRSAIFSEPTGEVVKRFIRSQLQSIREEGALQSLSEKLQIPPRPSMEGENDLA
jgi:hypothetical protein